MFLSPGSRAGRKRTGGGGGTPGGANTQVQFNNHGAFSGDAGLTYAGNGSLAINQGTLTSDIRALNITGTWNNGGLNFIPFQMNYINTNSNSPAMMDLQIGGVSFYQVVPPVGFQNAGINFIQQNAGGAFTFTSGGALANGNNAPNIVFATSRGTSASPTTVLTNDVVCQILSAPFDGGQNQFNASFEFVVDGLAGGVASACRFLTGPSSATERLRIDSVGKVLLGGGNYAPSLWAYNTVDSVSSPTNYERAVFDWTTTTNVLTIGTQAGGTGSGRNIRIDAGGNPSLVWIQSQSYGFASGAATQPGFSLAQTLAIGWTTGTTGLSGNDTGISRVAAGVLGVGTGAASNVGGWVQWAGLARVTSNFTSSNTTLTAITGISSVSLQASRNYAFQAWLAVTGSSVGGVLIGITSASTTITSLSADGYLLDTNTIRGGQGVITSTGTAVVSISSATVTSSNPSIRINGMIRVASSGTFGLTLAQSTANNAPQTIVSSGSWMIVQDMP